MHPSKKIFLIALFQSLTLLVIGQKEMLKAKKVRDDSSTNIVKKENENLLLKNGALEMHNAVKKLNPVQYVASIKDIAQPVFSKVKLITNGKLINVDNLSAQAAYNYNRDTSDLLSGLDKNADGFFHYNVNAGLALSSIPFTFNYSNSRGFSSAGSSSLTNYYKANFDAERYRDFLQTQVLKNIKPELILSAITNRIKDLRLQYESRLREKLSAVQRNFLNQFSEQLELPEGLSDLANGDLTNLKNKIFDDDLAQRYLQNKDRYERIVSAKNINSSGDSAVVKQILKDIKRQEILQNLYADLLESRENFENNKIVKELKSHLPFTPENYASFLKNPANLADVIRKYCSLSSLQNIFLKITKLDLGQNPVQNGELSIKGLMNTGINTSFTSEKTTYGFIAGKNSNTNTWLQSGLNNIITNEYSMLAGFMIGRQNGDNQSVSFNFYNFSKSPIPFSDNGFQPEYLSSGKRRDAVITLHKDIKIGAKHDIKVDASRSFGSYTNSLPGDSLSNSKSVVSSLLSNEGKMNYAFAIDYTGELLNTELQVLLKKVGLGYNNPGNIFLRKGESQLQMSFLRKFLKNKVSAIYNFDFRSQNFDPDKNYKYTTFSNKLALKLRLKKNNRIGLSYQQSNYNYLRKYEPTNTSLSSILQANGSYKFKILKKSISSTVSLSQQNIKLPLLVNNFYSSKSLLVVHSSSIMVKNNLCIVSVTANHSSNTDYYYNTSFFNSEVNYSYPLFTKILLTSGFGYYANKGWNNQIGIRQQAAIHLFDRMDIDIGVDCKRAVKFVRPELANQLYINSSLYYRFN